MSHVDAPAGRLTVEVGVARTRLLSADPERRSMTISPPVAGKLWMFPDNNLNVGEGIQLNWDKDPLLLCCCNLGRLIAATWFGIIEAGEGPITNRWDVTATGTDAESLAELAGVPNRRHRVGGGSGSFTTAQGLFAVELQVAAVARMILNVNDRSHIAGVNYDLEGAAGESVGLSVPAGGVGIVGRANLHGVTINAGDGGANVGVVESTIDPHGRY